ncbi:unnamed protein product [Rangifer tarandus platyrhynchus]|uniref:Uncharacterized protein n=2 Tax=Rangifer tarandus platyrhynchus TaxID=3082113 RepID=A0AC60A8Y5_RANTA|nr:unnamed protein product [Rangifer tarandus platyrhynchus]
MLALSIVVEMFSWARPFSKLSTFPGRRTWRLGSPDGPQPHSPAPLRQLRIQQAARHRQVTPWSWITAANDSGGEAATAGFQGDVSLNRQLQAERTLPDTRPPSPTLGPPGDSRRRSLDPTGTRVSTVFITT